MKLLNLKTLVGVAALSLAMIAGVSDVSAQGWGRNHDRQWIKQQQKLEKERFKVEQARLRLERQRLNTIQAQNRYRIYRSGRWYNTDSRGAELLRQAVNDGYRQGFAAGRSDRNRRISLNWGGSSVYRSGTYGYQSYVDRNQYQYYFRQGFERGYQDGYHSRNQYGTYNNGTANILTSILGSILNIQRY